MTVVIFLIVTLLLLRPLLKLAGWFLMVVFYFLLGIIALAILI